MASSFLSHPRAYNLSQRLVCSDAKRRTLFEGFLSHIDVPYPRILDIGCGTAIHLENLPKTVEYVGFDASLDYIEFARARYQHRNATFHHDTVEEAHLSKLEAFDFVFAAGILHHLDDQSAVSLFTLAAKALKQSGLLITTDPCFVENQHFISRWFIERDRGEYVRPLKSYGELAEKVFSNVELHHENNILRFPYDHAIMFCSSS